MSETVSTNQQEIAPIPAREVYPNSAAFRIAFNERLASGDITIEEVTDGRGEVNLETFNVARVYPSFDFSALERGDHTLEEVLAALPEDQREAFAAEEQESVIYKAYDTRLRQNAWWLPWGRSDIEDNNTWLDDAELKRVVKLEIGDQVIVVNDFSGNVDIEEFYKGLEGLTRQLIAAGINIAQYFKTINILPETHPNFAVPDHIKAKDPDLWVAALAGISGVFVFNEKALNKGYKREGNGFTYAQGWGYTFMHELGHFLNRGLADGSDEQKTIAKGLGWAKRVDVFMDDYGDLHEPDKGRFYGSYVVDDLGNERYIPDAALPEHLHTDGKKDSNGQEIKPPSRYAQENSMEDMAESFAAYMVNDPSIGYVDGARKKAVEEVLAKRRNIEPGNEPEVRVSEIKPEDLDVFDYLPKKIKVYRRIFYKF